MLLSISSSGVLRRLFLLLLVGEMYCCPGEGQNAARVTLHEDLVRAWQGEEQGVDLNDLHSVFWFVFSKFPPEVRVYPSENYYYWQLDIDGHHITGNLRLPAKQRDDGFVSFAYSERRVLKRAVDEQSDPDRIAGRALVGAEDGVILKKVRRGVYDMGYSDHFVRFHLEDLSQQAPEGGFMLEGEEFVGRTFDESGIPFILLYQRKAGYLFWVLDETRAGQVAEHFVELRPQVLMGRRSRFVFQIDAEASSRKVLIAVHAVSVRANDYYDGPFDQLPENHAENGKLQECLIRENSALDGKIDRYGYYVEDDPPMRVALVRYATYENDEHLARLVDQAASKEDWREYFARKPK